MLLLLLLLIIIIMIIIGYKNRVLILDEVDALVIDEEPNEAFVYPKQKT